MQWLAHRGPDDYGFFIRRGADTYLGRDFSRCRAGADLLLLHRRLAILDLSEAGAQPMASADGNLVIVFNGEIYNFVELRDDLAALGHRFRSNSDTEVLLAAFSEWGPASLERLVGMFALAIFDRVQNRLFLARDFFGIKPLYYAAADGRFGFASEVPPLIENLQLSRRANPRRIYTYLRFGMTDHGDETLFHEVRQVPPAHYLWVDLDSLEVSEPVRYWRLNPTPRSDLSFDEAATHVRELFLKNVALHMRSDVPVGAALSGGIDSSSIVMAMRRLGGEAMDLHLFSFIADDQTINEEKWSSLVAGASGGRMHKVTASAANLAHDLCEVTRIHGEPTASSSVYAQHHVFQAARAAGIKVMLDGQGADEILGGYTHYLGARLTSLLRQRRYPEALRFFRAVRRAPGVGTWGALLNAADHLLPDHWQGPFRMLIGKHLAPDWLNQSWFVERGVPIAPVKYTRQSEVLRTRLLAAVQEQGLAHLLRYEDRNSMAFSVESRVPFLTPELAAFTLSLPESYLISEEGVSKAVFRKAMRGIVPDAILDRRDKIGFATPETQWLLSNAHWVERRLHDEAGRAVSPLNWGVIQAAWRKAVARRRLGGLQPWRWLNLLEWTRQFEVDYS